jgi:hypothetical protein
MNGANTNRESRIDIEKKRDLKLFAVFFFHLARVKINLEKPAWQPCGRHLIFLTGRLIPFSPISWRNAWNNSAAKWTATHRPRFLNEPE